MQSYYYLVEITLLFGPRHLANLKYSSARLMEALTETNASEANPNWIFVTVDVKSDVVIPATLWLYHREDSSPSFRIYMA